MKRLLILLAGLTLSGGALGSSAVSLPYQFNPDLGNLASLQRGARNYMNYCAGCHAMKHLRYSRLSRDLQIPEELVKANLMFGTDKIGEPIKASLPAESAKWFGQVPPDLTVETRKRGADWVYNYLLTFYVDPSRPNGVNNHVLPGASMPHVLWELQGWQTRQIPEGEAGHGGKPEFTLVQPGSMAEKEFKGFVADTVNFMSYAAEPGKNHRIAVGVGVMLFLLFVLTPLAWLLKHEYWKDVH